jgi:hypothetical protein
MVGFKETRWTPVVRSSLIRTGTLNIPATVLAKHFSPAVVIRCLMLCWGKCSVSLTMLITESLQEQLQQLRLQCIISVGF